MSTLGLGHSDEELLTQDASLTLWRDSPDDALSGDSLFSAETSADLDLDRSRALVALAADYPDRFLTLISRLTPIIQDIFIQHYMLGRTRVQIGATLFPHRREETQRFLVNQGSSVGMAALNSRRGSKAWKAMLAWQSGSHPTRPVTLRAPSDLGAFVIVPNGQLREIFAPSWSALGPHSVGASKDAV